MKAMERLTRILDVGRHFMGGNGRVKLDSSPEPEDSPKPDLRSVLDQFFHETVMGDIRTLLGVFNPRYIGHNDRSLMILDPTVSFGLAILRAPLVNMKWTVESRDPIIKAFVEEQLKRHYRNTAVVMSNALTYGFQVGAKVWQTGPEEVEAQNPGKGDPEVKQLGTAWTYKKIKGIDPRTLTLIVDLDKDEWAGVKQKPLGMAADDSPLVGPERAMLWSFRAEDKWGNLRGFPMLDQCYEPWWWKTALNLMANRYFERRADPVFKAISDAVIVDKDGKTHDGFEYMARQLQAMKNGGTIILPNKRDIVSGELLNDVEYLADDKRGDMFDGRLVYLDIQILRSLWTADKAATSGDGTGSFAQAQVHADPMAGPQEMIFREWQDDVMNPQFVDPLVLHNFGAEALRSSRTRFKSGGLDQSMKDLYKEIITAVMNVEAAMANGERVTLAEKLDMEGIASSVGLPMRSQDEINEILEAKKKAAAEQAKLMQEDGGANPTKDDEDDIERDLRGRGALE